VSKVAGLTLRQAALIAGLGYLLNPVPYAEFALYPRLVISGHIDQTVANIAAHQDLFVAAIFCYLINFMGDIVIAWAFYVLLAPVNRAVSMLAAWFRLTYTVIALGATFNLVTVCHLITTPELVKAFGSNQLQAQVDLLLHSFRSDWALSLSIFGIHLVLVGCLMYASGYIPKLFGVVMFILGLGWIIAGAKPYFWPNLDLSYFFLAAFGELLVGLSLLVICWRIKEPAALRT